MSFTSVRSGLASSYPTGVPTTAHEPSAVLLAHGVLEELYRRRQAFGFTMAMALCLLATAVGLQVWSVEPTAGAAIENPGFTVSSSSSGTPDSGPSGTWQRWGDLGSQKRSQSASVTPARSSTTTFSETATRPGEPRTTTATTIGTRSETPSR